MKINSIKTIQHLIKYKDTINVAGRGYSAKDAFIVEVVTEHGTACTELNLFQGLHRTTYSEALDTYKNDDPNNYKSWHPQIKYPIEAALFRISNPNFQKGEILINGYFDPSAQEHAPLFECLKIKIGRRSQEEDFHFLKKVEDKRLRLDANQSLDKKSFEAYLPHVFHYDYFEEPFTDPELMKEFPKEKFALDENVEVEKLQQLHQVKAFVLKPGLLGLDKTIELIKKAKLLGKRSVISSTFESEVGLLPLLGLASYSDGIQCGKETHGLGTISFLSDPLKKLGICVASDTVKITY